MGPGVVKSLVPRRNDGMKKVLITGVNSYIGKSFEKLLKQNTARYSVDAISVRGDIWKEIDFSEYDVVFHVAAIVHKKEETGMKDFYLRINKDLPVAVAKLARESGVKQFVFMSTMAVYGENGKINEEITITKDTNPNPKSYYAWSKIEAENELDKLKRTDFRVVVLRPPMVYGPNCPGNYARLEKLATKIPIFPMIKNKRSMVHIDRLCQDVKGYIDDGAEGLFFPQDNEYVNTSLLVKKLANQNGRKIILSRSLGWMIKLIGNKFDIINKVFGNLVYGK